MDVTRFQQYYDRVVKQATERGDSPFHRSITDKIVKEVVLPLNLPFDSLIYDIGCNLGYFVDEMQRAGYTNIHGLATTTGMVAGSHARGHECQTLDFLSFDCTDSTVDFIFSRHTLTQSPFPFFTLLEYNRALKPGGKMYVDVPSPNSIQKHEFDLCQYSILGDAMWQALFLRAGFDILHTAPLTVGLTNAKTGERYDETYLTYLLEKRWKS